MRALLFAIVTVASVAFLAIPAKADIRPRSLAELKESELIVVGTIKQLRIETERSRVERGIGNYDWGIYLTLAIENVEKGRLKDAEIEFRCFRIKSRRSLLEYISLSGHRPIPGAGTRVRVYLNGGMSKWSATLPNGITPPDAGDDESVRSGGSLADATEVRDLSSLAYTYVLPIELWGLIAVVVVPVVVIRRLIRQMRKVPGATTQTDELEVDDVAR